MAYSDGAKEDEHRDKYTHLDMRYKISTNQRKQRTDKSEPIMETRFVLCTCDPCISRSFHQCYFTHIAGPVKRNLCHHLYNDSPRATMKTQKENREARQVRINDSHMWL